MSFALKKLYVFGLKRHVIHAVIPIEIGYHINKQPPKKSIHIIRSKTETLTDIREGYRNSRGRGWNGRGNRNRGWGSRNGRSRGWIGWMDRRDRWGRWMDKCRGWGMGRDRRTTSRIHSPTPIQ